MNTTDNINDGSWLLNEADLLSNTTFNLEDPILNFAALSASPSSLTSNATFSPAGSDIELMPWLAPFTAVDQTIIPSIISPPPSSPESNIDVIKPENTETIAHLPSPVLSSTSPASVSHSPLTPFEISQAAFPALYVNETSASAPVAAAPAPVKKQQKKRVAEDKEEDDDTVYKRMKNTEAARRSRARKVARMESLEADVNRLEGEKANLLVRLAVVESENSSLMQREVELNKRIHDLEHQLAESHRAMNSLQNMPALKKKKPLGDLLASLANPTPSSFDPDLHFQDSTGLTSSKSHFNSDDDEDAVAVERGDDEGREHYVEVGVGKVRKEVGVLVDEVRYAGKRTSRKELEGDQSDDDEDDDEEGEDFGEEDSAEGEEGESDQEDSEEEDDDDESSDENDDDEDIERQNKIESELKKIEEDEKKMVKAMHQSAKGDVEKGIHVKAQMSLWDSILDIRIQFQKAITVANRLPTPSTFPAFIYPGALSPSDANDGLSAVSAASKELASLIGDLLHLRATLTSKNESVKMASNEIVAKCLDSKKKRKRSLNDDGHDQDASTFLESSKDVLASTYADISAFDSAFKPFRDATIEKWNAKVVAAAGGAAAAIQMKKLKAINTSVLTQIKTILQDRDRLVKRTRLVRDSDGPRFGDLPTPDLTTNQDPVPPTDPNALVHPSRQSEALDTHLSTHDPHIFDDTDFYQLLLKELIESRMSDTSNPILLATKFAELRELQRKQRKKKKVDTKASKGRKIRYHVHEKLMNFMVPVPKGTWHESMVEELFGSLFGHQQAEAEEGKMDVDGGEIVVPNDGLKLFG
ncbi:hypothetical protein HDV05_001117 [Chytridiales sp. JEL 0842]|nr:hypothetical protein HDV05_001117 [Chytridiales sp. JEL 0842]